MKVAGISSSNISARHFEKQPLVEKGAGDRTAVPIAHASAAHRGMPRAAHGFGDVRKDRLGFVLVQQEPPGRADQVRLVREPPGWSAFHGEIAPVQGDHRARRQIVSGAQAPVPTLGEQGVIPRMIIEIRYRRVEAHARE